MYTYTTHIIIMKAMEISLCLLLYIMSLLRNITTNDGFKSGEFVFIYFISVYIYRNIYLLFKFKYYIWYVYK